MKLQDASITSVDFVTTTSASLKSILRTLTGRDSRPEGENRFSMLSGTNITFRPFGMLPVSDSSRFTQISLVEVDYEKFPELTTVAATATIAEDVLTRILDSDDEGLAREIREELREWWNNHLADPQIPYVITSSQMDNYRLTPPTVSVWRLYQSSPIEIHKIDKSDLKGENADRELARAIRRESPLQDLGIHDNAPLSIVSAYPNKLVTVADSGPSNIAHSSYSVVEISSDKEVETPAHLDPYNTALSSTSTQIVDAIVPSLFCYYWLRNRLSAIRDLQRQLRAHDFTNVTSEDSDQDIGSVAEDFRDIESTFYDEHSRYIFYRDYVSNWIEYFPSSLLGGRPPGEAVVPAGSLIDSQTEEPVRVGPFSRFQENIRDLLSAVGSNADSMRESVDSTASHVQRVATLKLSSSNLDLQRWARWITGVLVVIGLLQLSVSIMGPDSSQEALTEIWHLIRNTF